MDTLAQPLWSFIFLPFLFPFTNQLLNMGPYELILKKLQNCPDAGSKKFSVQDVKLKRVAQDILGYDAKMSLKMEWGNNIEGKFEVWKMKDNKKTSHFYTHEFRKFCDEGKKYMPSVFKDCPFAAKEYDVHTNVSLKLANAPATLPYGPYWFKGELMDSNSEVVGCFEYWAEFAPRDAKKKG